MTYEIRVTVDINEDGSATVESMVIDGPDKPKMIEVAAILLQMAIEAKEGRAEANPTGGDDD